MSKKEEVKEYKHSGMNVKAESQIKLNYFEYVIQLIRDPDIVLKKEFKGYHRYGLINIVMLIGLIFLNNLTRNISVITNEPWYVREFISSIKITFSYAIALILVLVFLNWVATKVIDNRSISYYTEKFGAVQIYPSILLFVSIVLNYYQISFYSWFSTIAFSFIYIGIFIIAYLFTVRHNFKVSAIFVLIFFFVSKIIYFIL